MSIVNRIGEYSAKHIYKVLWDFENKKHDLNISKVGSDSFGDGYVKSVKGDCYIEPKSGYIVSDGALIYESMTPNFDYHMPVWKFTIPSVSNIKKAINISDNVVHFDKVISLRHFWDWNYYHFYFDVLGKLKAFDDQGVGKDIPVVLGKYVDQLSFPRQVIGMGQFKERTWLVPGDKYVHANEVFYCRHRYSLRDICEYIVKTLEVDRENVRNDKIYLTRGVASSGRNVSNESEILNVLSDFDFKVIDANKLTVENQVEVFRNAQYVVAPHGAGITNILFRSGNPLSLLELHPIHAYTDFKKICDGYGYYWDHLMGIQEPGDPRHANYTIDPDALRKSLVKLIESGGTT